MKAYLNKAAWLGLGVPLPRWAAVGLGLLPFVLLGAAYLVLSDIRLAENPADKLMPALSTIGDTAVRYMFQPDLRTGKYLLLDDWLSSMQRICLGLGLAAFVGLVLGVATGLFPYIRSSLLPFVTFASIVPPLAILPILFILFGVDEIGKVALIFLGSVWFIARDIYEYASNIPKEQIVKVLTFNASLPTVIRRVILPQVMPRLIDASRLSLGAAWLFLIASEAIASTDGLGYRIFLVRRYLAMDVIILYVIVITITGFLLDMLLRKAIATWYPWYAARKRA